MSIKIKTPLMLVRIFGILVCMLAVSAISAQNDDPVLFTVEDNPVHVSEFDYIYSKTNGEKATYSKASLEEYLDLYTKFKLKVQKARDMKLDTIVSLQRELEGYRKQLAKSYLSDKEVTDRLVKEAYDRKQYDIEVSHVMTSAPAGKDTTEAYQKIKKAQAQILSGTPFEKVAKEFTEDKKSAKQGGNIGWLTAMMPSGFYAVENAIYTTPKGKTSSIIKSPAGYHLFKVHEKRPARGEIEVAHILIRIDPKKNQGPAVAKARIDSIYNQLKAGGDFESMVAAVSQDSKTSTRKGYLGFFGINRYEKSFEDAAFALQADGDFSNPVQTVAGWHIIKRLSRKSSEPFDIASRRLQAQIQKDSRYNLAKTALVNRIKKENGFSENSTLLNGFVNSLTDTFLTYKWKPVYKNRNEVLFTIAEKASFYMGQYESYLQRAGRQRLRAARGSSPAKVATQLYQDFVEESVIQYEESLLEEKYPDFKALMREYREGILLFEATKRLVWDKASQDTTGLKNFYEKNKSKYVSGELAKIKIYSISPKTKSKLIPRIEKAISAPAGSKGAKALKKYNKYLAQESYTINKEGKVFDDRTRSFPVDKLAWENGASQVLKSDEGNVVRIMKVEELLEPKPKPLSQVRGYAIADYQDQLEKEWVASLKEEYKVKVNEDIFKGLIK